MDNYNNKYIEWGNMERQVDTQPILGSPNLITSNAVANAIPKAISKAISNISTPQWLFSTMRLGSFNIDHTWGTVNSTNGYTMLFGGDQPNGGGLEIGEKSEQTYIQIDGDYYGQEGRKKVAYADDVFPISGGYIRGFITRDAGGSWISARDNVIVKTTRTSGEGSDWHPIIGAKTSNGFWSFGSVGGETLCLSYDTDANYNTSNNTSRITYFPHLSGTFAVMNNNSQSGDFYASNVYAGSDIRLKENIKDINIDSLDIIKKIKLHEYNFINDKTKQKNIGVIAQELKEILPDDVKQFYVAGNEETGYLAVNDSKLVYLLIDVVQKQQKQIDELKAKLEG